MLKAEQGEQGGFGWHYPRLHVDDSSFSVREMSIWSSFDDPVQKSMLNEGDGGWPSRDHWV
jgi:hypothetical protein